MSFRRCFSVTLVLFVLIASGPATAQTHERLFCGFCGTENFLLHSFCRHCGARLDKRALIQRLRHRLSTADSANQQITMTAGEVTLLLEAEAHRAGNAWSELQTKPMTDIEKTLHTLAPVAIGLGALYFISVFGHIMAR